MCIQIKHFNLNPEPFTWKFIKYSPLPNTFQSNQLHLNWKLNGRGGFELSDFHGDWYRYFKNYCIYCKHGAEAFLQPFHPQMNVAAISKALLTYKVYQTMFRIVKESETVDSRQHCYLLQ